MKNIIKVLCFSVVSMILVALLASLGFDYDKLFLSKEYSETSLELSKAEAQINEMYHNIEYCNDEISKNEYKMIQIINDIKNTNEYMKEQAKISGCTDLRGPGITVKISDNLSEDIFSMHDKIVHNLDILAIVNDLNVKGAEAIAINGKRIVSGTEISCIGPVIRINGEAQAPPFIIKAIGKPSDLLSAIEDENSYANLIKSYFGINVSAMKNLDIFIGKNADEINYDFVEIVKE